MVSDQLLSYDDLEDLLATHECDTQGAELQGMLCGLFSGGMPNNDQDWIIPVMQQINGGKKLSGSAMNPLSVYCRQIGEKLESDIFALDLALPDDRASLSERLTSIGKWCEGFLLGYGLTTNNKKQFSDDLQEALSDLAEISQIDPDADEGDEMEKAYYTVIEHVKVAAQIIYVETRSSNSKVAQSTGSSNSIH